jgi:hypothetical protein
MGCSVYSLESSKLAEAELVPGHRRPHVDRRYARRYRSAGVEGCITYER